MAPALLRVKRKNWQNFGKKKLSKKLANNSKKKKKLAESLAAKNLSRKKAKEKKATLAYKFCQLPHFHTRV